MKLRNMNILHEETLHSNQSQIIEEATFTYSSLKNILEKKEKRLKMQSKNKQRLLKTLNTDQYFKLVSDLFLKIFSSADARNEFKKIEKSEHEINDLINKTGNKTIRSF